MGRGERVEGGKGPSSGDEDEEEEFRPSDEEQVRQCREGVGHCWRR